MFLAALVIFVRLARPGIRCVCLSINDSGCFNVGGPFYGRIPTSSSLIKDRIAGAESAKPWL